MCRIRLVATTCVAGMVGAGAHGSTIWDNGDPNGVGAYSNATAGVFGARRTLLDDFDYLVPDPGWAISAMHWNSVWSTPMGGAMGVGAEISFRSDNSGTPGMVLEIANITGYSELLTGNILFSREEVAHWATFSEVQLPMGERYWVEATVVGPENNFWLTSDQQLEECWVNYDDLGGLAPGTDQFGAPSGINFKLAGVPAPGTVAFAGVAALFGCRRRRSCRPA